MRHLLFDQMTTEKLKSSKTRLKSSDSIEQLRRKSTDYLFQPIASAHDLINQRKPPSPFQTGLRYLKFLGQIKRRNDHLSNETHPIKSTVLERTSAFSTNYYAPLPPLTSHSTNRSIQVDDLDDLSYQTARDSHCSLSLPVYEFVFTLFSILFFISIIFLMQFNSHPIHCFLHKKFWYPTDLPAGFPCQKTQIEIHYVEIYSLIYQMELQRNPYSINCLGFEILSCLPIDYSSVPKGRLIRRNDQLINYCNHTPTINCQNQSLSIAPHQYKWNFKNNQLTELVHCSCLQEFNRTNCFHFMITDQCDYQIPWFDYCLKYSTTQSTCKAYVQPSR